MIFLNILVQSQKNLLHPSQTNPPFSPLNWARPYFFVLPAFSNLRWLTFSTLLLSALVNVYLIMNQFHTGAAAVLMVEQLDSKKLISETDPGIIRGHIGNRFLFDNIPKKYSVVAGTRRNELFSVESGSFPWLKKTYSLIPIQ